MATISERLRKLSGAMLAADIDMRLPEGSIDPDEAADTIDALAEVAAIFLGGDARFHVAVGGNPNAIEEMLEKSRSALARAKG